MYIKFIKRLIDICCALIALITFCWLYIIIAILVRVKLGSPIIFVQKRPGRIDPKTGIEKIFKLYKFRTMTDARDENGDYLPDDFRLTRFGKALRSFSLDELPEAWNILIGDMSVIGPRPQLVKDLVFMNEVQRQRHIVRPGLSGLAQINGRNGISWEEKLNFDLLYLKKLSLYNDIRIVFLTVDKVLKRDGINADGVETAEDFGDYLLKRGFVSKEEYDKKQLCAKLLLEKYKNM